MSIALDITNMGKQGSEQCTLTVGEAQPKVGGVGLESRAITRGEQLQGGDL